VLLVPYIIIINTQFTFIPAELPWPSSS